MKNSVSENSFTDNRGRKIVYVSCCLLNQNSISPGIATRKAAFTELIQLFLNNDIGIEQLPCMECILWGGVSRKTIRKTQPFVFNSVGKMWFPIIEFFSNIVIRKTKNGCRKSAKQVVARMQDYINEGYEIIGILGVNGSPTCGVNLTMNYVNIVKNKKHLALTLEDLIHPQLEKMINLETKVRINGSGYFFNHIIKELRKRKLDIKVLGIDPLLKPEVEVEKIAGILNLKL